MAQIGQIRPEKINVNFSDFHYPLQAKEIAIWICKKIYRLQL